MPLRSERQIVTSQTTVRAASLFTAVLLAGCAATPPAPPPAPATAAPPPAGSVSGTVFAHTPDSLRARVERAQVVLPAASGAPFFGRWQDIPAGAARKVPVVVFLHGSSGLGLKAIEEWQRWLGEQGIASVAPDSFALPGRATYKSPIDKPTYERFHALRAGEAAAAIAALRTAPWADPARVVLAGTSEGAVAVARHGGEGLAGRIIFAWSCEDNYFVAAHDTQAARPAPVLNVISSTDPFFSPSNAWLGNANARGHCGTAFAAHKQATIVLIPGAPHTLLNLPAARIAAAGFLRQVFGNF
jgi:hypothetical protein